MSKTFFLFLFTFMCILNASAQTVFINKARIEFQVKTNNHKSFDAWFDDEDQESSWQENYKSNTTKYSVSYYDFEFANNRSIYTFRKLDEKNRNTWDNEARMEGNTWYHNYNDSTAAYKRMFWGEEFVFTDSLRPIKWKMVPNESRMIAGFNCRKAVAVLFDSVYVFAFYTDEITISGGPQGLYGLPGMILGVTVPRMYTSWIASRVMLNGVDENRIASPAGKKPKSRRDILQKFMQKAEEEGRWMQRNIWNLFL